MKVGLLTSSFPRFPGDHRGIFVKNLVDALRAQGVTVDVIEPRGYAALKTGAGLVPNLKRSMAARVLFPFYCVHFLALAVARAGSCDLLHANWSLSGTFAVIAARLRRRPVILTERSPALIGTSNAGINRWMRWVMTRCDAVVTISEAARATLAAKFPDIEIGVVPNGVDDVRFSPERRKEARRELGLDDDSVHVITVGRLTAVKRFDVLVAALSALAEKGRPVRGWVVGDGELRGEIERSVAGRPALAGRVACLGPLPQDDVARWVTASDVFVLTSAAETGGNVVLESMSAGLAVVSTAVGWAADFISSGKNGIIIPIGDVDALVRELDALMDDVPRRRALGEAARRTIEERGLNWQGCARNYIGWYRQVMEKTR